MNTQTADTIQIGDVIMPPERELRLWMRRHIATHNLPESALFLNVTGIYHSNDKGGTWLHFKTMYPDIWPGGAYAFTFKARPATPWTIIRKAEANQ